MLRLKDENGVYGFHFSMTLRNQHIYKRMDDVH